MNDSLPYSGIIAKWYYDEFQCKKVILYFNLKKWNKLKKYNLLVYWL